MIPLKDDNPTRRTAWMTILLIVANASIWLVQLAMSGPAGRDLIQAAGLVPARLSAARPMEGLPPALTLITSQFLHGGFLHVAGNMLFLWIFGNNVEDELGAFRFLAFYLACGVAAGLAHYASQPGSTVPTIGASGAISGVLGAYALLFPRARVHTLIFLVFYITVIPIPALLWVGIWFILQLLQGLASQGAAGGVAWFAHVGGALAGVILILIFRPRRPISRVGPFTGSWAQR